MALATACVADGDRVAQVAEALTQCPGPNILQGVDVSEWQGNIDWGAVAASGVAFAVTRVSDGFYQDPYFDQNWAGIRNAGMVRGVYQFFRPGRDAVGQADLLLRRIGSLQPGDLPPVLDVEVTDGVGPAEMNAQIHRWVDRIRAGTGRAPMIYTGSYFWDDNVGTGDFADLPLWLPAYSPWCPRLPNAWARWRIHQYSSDGNVPGIGGRVDVNRFDGTPADLRVLAAGTCSAHCEGAVAVHADCTRDDCGASGAACQAQGDAVRCVMPPRGSFDSAGCDVVAGWAQDPGAPDAALAVHVYVDGPAGSGATAFVATAGEHRADLCGAIGSCDHGFVASTPASVRDGRAHTLYAYAISATGGPLNPPLPGSPRTVRCAVPEVADVNGDGRADLMQFRGDWGAIPVCLSLGAGWSCRNLPATDVDESGAPGNAGSGIFEGATPLFGHFNDDPWIDVVEFGGAGGRLPVCASLVTGWSCRALAAPYAGGAFPAAPDGSAVYPGATALIGDFDGDHRSDVVQFNAGWQSLPVCRSLGTGWSCRNLGANAAGGAGTGNGGSGIHAGSTALVGDFDGDGRSDVLQWNPAGTTLPVCRSIATGWSCADLAATHVGPGDGGNAGSGVWADATPLLGDFDGDGRTDLIEYRPHAPTLPVCLSLGTGWSCRELAATHVGGDFGAGIGGSGIHGGVALTGDFNGDGRTDVVQYDDGGQSLPVCLSLGTGWSCANRAATRAGDAGPAGNGGSGIFAHGTPLVGDFDGDGRDDVLQYQADGWTTIPVCLSLGTGWSCRALAADYTGGVGAGVGGSGVY